jgi:hypothetical protein
MAATDDAIVTALRGDAQLKAMLSKGAAAIGHGGVEPGTKAPYVLVLDMDQELFPVFGNRYAHGTDYYRIVAYTMPTRTESAQAVADRILSRVYAVLHDQPLAITGLSKVVVSRGVRVRTKWETISDNERYFKDGHNWAIWGARS